MKAVCWPTMRFVSMSRRVTTAVRMTSHLSSPSIASPGYPKDEYDAVVIGAGHNGLICAAYLQRQGLRTCVLERRAVIGGATVTEEIVPGYLFTRASYVLSLLRPQIVEELQLKEYGLHVYLRDPSSYTPLRKEFHRPGGPSSLTLSSDERFNTHQISRFSQLDAQNYVKYNSLLGRLVEALDPLLDIAPPDVTWQGKLSLADRVRRLRHLWPLVKACRAIGPDLLSFYELMTAPSGKFLNQWFESEPLKATLVTDSVIGAMVGPDTPGTGYNLLHHVAGEIDGVKGAWGYPRGGMGAVSNAIYKCLCAAGGHVFTDQPVDSVCVENGRAVGVKLRGGSVVRSRLVFSNATPAVTFLQLLPEHTLPHQFRTAIQHFNCVSPVCKINVALSRLPNFLADPNLTDTDPMPHHRCSIHLNAESMQQISTAHKQALAGHVSTRPLIEMVIPSALDPTLAPAGRHVCSLFTQYCPYKPVDAVWDQQRRQQYAQTVMRCIDEYAPGFSNSIVGMEVLAPPDLHQIFGLTGGNIFHGALSLDQLFSWRPTGLRPGPRTPVPGLYLCGSGTHPGGGVMGAPGRIGALLSLTHRDS